MKPRNREINIFNMSALDLFASALGAFILISVVLFPYFPNTGDSAERVADIKKKLEESQTQLAEAQQQLKSCIEEKNRQAQELQQVQNELQECAAQLAKRFVLVLISWGTTDDIDLHVIDPQGREFYYKKKTFPGTAAKLEEDNIRGPGNEIWLHPAAEPGEYKVYYHYYARRSRSVEVRGAMLTPDGRVPIPNRRLFRKGEKPFVAVIRVNQRGIATLENR